MANPAETIERYPLTKSELAILRAIDAAEFKKVAHDALRRSVGLTMRGFSIVIRRMEGEQMVGRMYGRFGEWTITFKGMQALEAARVSS